MRLGHIMEAVLTHLYEHREGFSHADIIRSLYGAITPSLKSGVSRSIRMLEKQGLCDSVKVGPTRRVTITSKGVEYVEERWGHGL